MSTAIALRADPVIAKLDSARLALSEAKSIQQAKSIADVAAAAEIYAERQRLGEEAIGYAHAIKIEALRKVGELVRDAPKAKGQLLRGSAMEPRESTPTLADLGIDKKTSHIAQRLAALPDEQFAEVRDGHTTIGKAIAAVEATKPAPTEGARNPAAPSETEQLRAELAEMRGALKEAADEIQRLAAIKGEGDDPGELIKTLQSELRAVTARRDDLMRENSELKAQIRALERALAKASKK